MRTLWMVPLAILRATEILAAMIHTTQACAVASAV
jgi:hypothetical protein